MSAFILVPTVFWKDYSAIDFGTPVYGIEYNAMNAVRSDYVSIESGVATIDFTHSAALAIPTTISSASGAIWTKWGDTILDDVSPNQHYMQLWTGATIGTVAQKTLVTVYGDATASSDDIVVNPLVSKTDGYSHMIGVFDDQYTSVAWQIKLLNYGSPTIPEPLLYEVMIGHVFALPDGYVREERAIQRVHYGGRVGVRAFGDASWSGIYSHSPRKSFELQMEGLVESDRNIWRDVFRYGRGVFPVLVVEDSSDKTTWTKAKMTRLYIEEDSKMYNLTLEFDEI